MRIFFLVLVAVIALAGGAIAFLPMSVAADAAAKQFPDFHYSQASGSVWDGKLYQVSYQRQFVGDVSVKTELLALLGGRAAGVLGLDREGLTLRAGVSYGFGDGGLDLKDVKLDGAAAILPGLPAPLASSGGKFRVSVTDARIVQQRCQSAAGEVWTDVLARVAVQGWVGPELRGPVTCSNGRMQMTAGGKAATGEVVQAVLSADPGLAFGLRATVANASPRVAQVLAEMGFRPEGGLMVLDAAPGG